MLRRFNLETPYLGTVALATDAFVVVGEGLNNKKGFINDVLDVPVIEGDIFETKMFGVLAVGNSNGILVSPKITDLELSNLESELPENVDIERLDTKTNALGNIIEANDNKAVVGSKISENNLNKIESVLGVEAELRDFGGSETVGSSIVITNKGGLIHPDLDAKTVSSFFDVYVESGTSNKGVKEIGTCIIANSNGALTGEKTTGPELGTIERSLNFI